MRGECYLYDYIRVEERNRALRALEKARQQEREKQRLVDEGKAKWVIEQIPRGFIKHFIKL